jgi:hypothetical protein
MRIREVPGSNLGRTLVTLSDVFVVFLSLSRKIQELCVKMDLDKMRCESVDWIHLAQDSDQWRALVNMVMNLRVL